MLDPIALPSPTDLGRFERPTVDGLARSLGISYAAAELYLASEVVDLHVESFSFTRSFGYDLRKRHGLGLHRAQFFGQADFPRLLEAGVNGAVWSITANPLRPTEDRAASFSAQLRELKGLFEAATPLVEFVRDFSEYRAARARGAQAAFVGVQGANALDPDPARLGDFASELVKICLLHLTRNQLGATSTWSGFATRDAGLGARGHEFIAAMNEQRVLVDLAHIHPRAFWEAVRAAHPGIPLLVSHTGVSGVHAHWRNLDDAQLRAVAASGGTVGIMYHSAYLGDPLFAGRLASVARHIQHALGVIGPEHVSLGSDWDGLICTPRDMPTCLELPRLVQALLGLGISEEAIEKVLGLNFLRILGQVRPGAPS